MNLLGGTLSSEIYILPAYKIWQFVT